MLEGALQGLEIEAGSPARYALRVTQRAAGQPGGDVNSMRLNPLLDKELQIVFDGNITCLSCGARTRRSYGDGHCYRCFTHLARCDLCVVSPLRCHYTQGTCREPEWGERFCLQAHLVYLANSSGPKVGLTREGGQVRRWLEQGACQGLVVATAPSRHLAGVVEARLAREVSDRTDWRALVRSDAPAVDLPRLRERLRAAAQPLPPGVRWLDAEQVTTLEFPVLGYPARPRRFDLSRSSRVAGRLVGIKGQYLLFEHGVLNLRRHRGYHVTVTFDPVPQGGHPCGNPCGNPPGNPCGNPSSTRGVEPAPGSSQMELFQ